MQSIYSTEALAHGTSKDLECQKGKIKCSSIIKQYKNVQLLFFKRRHNPNWPEFHDHL